MGLIFYNEKNLIKLASKGDETAIKRLYERYVGFLAAVCRRYIPDYDEAMDVLQDGMIKIFSEIHRFEYRGKGSLKAWMTRIIINDSLKYLRDKKKNVFISINEEVPIESGANLEGNPVSNDNAGLRISDYDKFYDEESNSFSDIEAKDIQKLIQALPDGYRTVFNLYVFENKSHKEIGKILGISENSSASQYHRAKKKLAGEIMKMKKN